MDQDFDFTKFELKFEQDNKLQTICSFLHKINTDANTPLIPNDETETGLKTLLKALNIAKPPEQHLFTISSGCINIFIFKYYFLIIGYKTYKV